MFREALQTARRTVLRTAITATVVVGTLEVTTRLPSQGRSSTFYHKVADEWVTPLMRRFLGPEVAHNVAIAMAKRGLAPQYHPSALEQRVSVESNVFGKTFPNPIGLGAGFDKDGQVIGPMLALGFGFVEIGTVTLQPQAGNPQPRMFRLPQDLGIINRYGFNSQGANVVEHNLMEYRSQQQPDSKDKKTSWMQRIWTFLYPPTPSTGLVGINIGKNKTTTDGIADYVSLIQQLGPYADYLVLNISSPNTAGLRDLQEPDALRPLLQACLQARDTLPTHVPLLIKLAPDLTDDELQDIATTCLEFKVDGVVVTNTTNQRPNDLVSHHRSESGGLSGAPIKDASTNCIRKLYQMTNGKLPIIGVGGVGSGHDAYEKFKAGASLVQVYSMMVYKGPGVVSRIRHELAECMLQNGQRRIQDVVGMDHEEITWRANQEQMQRERQQVQAKVLAES